MSFRFSSSHGRLRAMPKARAFAFVGALALVGCLNIDTAKANKKVEDSNAAMEVANKASKDADDATKEAADKMPSDPDAAADPAKKCMSKLDEAAAKIDEASKLLKEASEMKVSKEFSDYLSLMSKSHAKVSESLELRKGFCKAIADKTDPQKLTDVAAKMNADYDGKQKEAADLQEQAEKIRKDNPTKFQQ